MGLLDVFLACRRPRPMPLPVVTASPSPAYRACAACGAEWRGDEDCFICHPSRPSQQEEP